jgi:hypothetical protein
MKGKKIPKVYEISATLLTCSRDSRATSHPRIGVRVSPAASEVEASIRATIAVVSVLDDLGRLRS